MQVFISIGQHRGSRLRGSMVTVYNSRPVFQMGYTVFLATSNAGAMLLLCTPIGLWCPQDLPTSAILAGVRIAWRNFTLHLSNDSWCHAPFHVLVCHLYTLFGDVSTQIFCPLTQGCVLTVKFREFFPILKTRPCDVQMFSPNLFLVFSFS